MLLIQETKLSDGDAPVMPMRMLGYEMAHHGEGRWNGVAILCRVGLEDVVTNFGDGPVRDSSAGAAIAVSEDDFDPFGEARMVSAVCGGVRVASPVRAERPRGGSPFFEGKLRWFERLSRWLAETRSPDEPLVLGGDYNVTPADIDVWSPVRAHGGTHVSEPEREALARLRAWGLVDTYRALRPEGGPVLVVGLPGRHVPPQRGHAHRPAVRDRAGGASASSGRRSTARRARARRRRRTTRRSSSTSTSRASRSMPAGPARSSGSLRGRSRAPEGHAETRTGRWPRADPAPAAFAADPARVETWGLGAWPGR